MTETTYTESVDVTLANDRQRHHMYTTSAGIHWIGHKAMGQADDDEDAWMCLVEWADTLKEEREREADTAIDGLPDWVKTIAWFAVKAVDWVEVARSFYPAEAVEAADRHLRLVRGQE